MVFFKTSGEIKKKEFFSNLFLDFSLLIVLIENLISKQQQQKFILTWTFEKNQTKTFCIFSLVDPIKRSFQSMPLELKTYSKRNWKSVFILGLAIFRQLYDHLSQNWGLEGHFQVLNGFKS